MPARDRQQPPSPLPVTSVNSGSYNPGPVNDSDMPSAELQDVQAEKLELVPEEFAEGPYGAATNASRLGKTSAWEDGQTFAGRYRDNSLITSDKHNPLHEPSFDAPEGSIEGQN